MKLLTLAVLGFEILFGSPHIVAKRRWLSWKIGYVPEILMR